VSINPHTAIASDNNFKVPLNENIIISQFNQIKLMKFNEMTLKQQKYFHSIVEDDEENHTQKVGVSLPQSIS